MDRKKKKEEGRSKKSRKSKKTLRQTQPKEIGLNREETWLRTALECLLTLSTVEALAK